MTIHWLHDQQLLCRHFWHLPHIPVMFLTLDLFLYIQKYIKLSQFLFSQYCIKVWIGNWWHLALVEGSSAVFGKEPQVYLIWKPVFVCLGESGLTCTWSDQQEHAGTFIMHVWRGTAADLHAHAARLLPTIHELQHVRRTHTEPWRAHWVLTYTHECTQFRHRPNTLPCRPGRSLWPCLHVPFIPGDRVSQDRSAYASGIYTILKCISLD